MQGKAAYIRSKLVGPFPGPCASGNYVHRAALFDVTRIKKFRDSTKCIVPCLMFNNVHDESSCLLGNDAFCFLLVQEADGKKIQIQLTGFMEKNTVKFMKELWNLLLSAQQNASGVPQLFLDEKEAEIQQRKVFLSKIIPVYCQELNIFEYYMLDTLFHVTHIIMSSSWN
jgi:hypothetical protein